MAPKFCIQARTHLYYWVTPILMFFSVGVYAASVLDNSLEDFVSQIKDATPKSRLETRLKLVEAKSAAREAKLNENAEATENEKKAAELGIRGDMLGQVETLALKPLLTNYNELVSGALLEILNQDEIKAQLKDGGSVEHVVSTGINNDGPFNIVVKASQAKVEEGGKPEIKLSFGVELSEANAAKSTNPTIKNLIKKMDDSPAKLAAAVKEYSDDKFKAEHSISWNAPEERAAALEQGIKDAGKLLVAQPDSKNRKALKKDIEDSKAKENDALEKAKIEKEAKDLENSVGSKRALEQREKLLAYLGDSKNNARGKEPCEIVVKVVGWNSLDSADQEACEAFDPKEKKVADKGSRDHDDDKISATDKELDRGIEAQKQQLEQMKLDAERGGLASQAGLRLTELMQNCLQVYQQEQAKAPFRELEKVIKPMAQALYTKAPGCTTMGALLPSIKGGAFVNFEKEARAVVRGADDELEVLSSLTAVGTYDEAIKRKDEVRKKRKEFEEEQKCLKDVMSYSAFGMDMFLTNSAKANIPEEVARQSPDFLQFERFNLAASDLVAEHSKVILDVDRISLNIDSKIEQLRMDARGRYRSLGSGVGAAPAFNSNLVPRVGSGGSASGQVGPPTSQQMRPADRAAQQRAYQKRGLVK